jgi:tRNA-specific 2-thiouridylase
LFSGGIDSILAVKLMQQQKIDVEALHVDIGFNSSGDYSQMRRIARGLNIPLTIVNDTQHYINDILFTPTHGYGKHLNPCVDCHANFLTIGWEHAKKTGAPFIVSGEVLGQRGMSQTAEQMAKVDKMIGEISAYTLRPLSAKLLPATMPEQEGWVDREKLLDISGKGKKQQLELLRGFGIDEFVNVPGCLLTDKNYTDRLQFFREKYHFEERDVQMVKMGRHFLLGNKLLIVARNEHENNRFEKIEHPAFHKIVPGIKKSPLAFIDKEAKLEEKNLAARIILRYAKPGGGESTSLQMGPDTIHQEAMENEEELSYLF